MSKVIHALSMVSLLFPLAASAEWGNGDWPTANKITINAEGATAAVTDMPAVVRLHSGNFDFAGAKPDGSDLRFVAADGKTELKYHIEKFDAVNGLGVIWVRLPKVDPKDKAAITLYSGNENAAAVADAKGTFDAATVAAYHFAEKTLLQDASASGLLASGEVSVQKTALLGEAATFSGKPLKLASAKLGGDAFTWSAWIKPAAMPQQAMLFTHGDLNIKLDGAKLTLTAGAASISGGEIKPAAWQHIAVTVGGGNAVLYVNGVAVANGAANFSESQSESEVGAGYTGDMDELQLANALRTADWIKLAASGQSAEGKLLTVQASEEGDDGEGGESYMGILLSNLTMDAKVVIGILAVMFAISMGVMVGKANYIRRSDGDNRDFLRGFRDASDGFLNLDQAGKFVHSPIYRLYQVGVREVRKRHLENADARLSAASLNAIRAAVDADLVRETHRINAQMVLLTIAISGGPFLGLLGTVVGVMITFAAIAAAGDVNVNAIAPGIAAALLATVAGLGVAIPSLFGYNYLASRIKNITADMQIFVDEFITRLAEVHGE